MARGDLQNPRWMYVKAVLFVVGGVLGSASILLESPRLKTAALLALTVWCFSRAYFFVFYVIERWIDPGFRFSGLVDFAQWLVRRR
ncbi:MAG: hypothetical protein SFW67_11630 [Myxococcaceae bacterium]|nr:hypothetical protein [Myxococcaceae bacterium]